MYWSVYMGTPSMYIYINFREIPRSQNDTGMLLHHSESDAKMQIDWCKVQALHLYCIARLIHNFGVNSHLINLEKLVVGMTMLKCKLHPLAGINVHNGV